MAYWQVFENEHAKTAAAAGLHALAALGVDNLAFRLLRGGERVQNPSLTVAVGGMKLENPLLVGAGWDKTGRAIDGLYALGFAGVEVGTVVPNRQPGNPRPRLHYKNGAACNSMGFNSPGMAVLSRNLSRQNRHGVIGISLGKNKYTPVFNAPNDHAVVAEHLRNLADYFVINVTSPNTPGLRRLAQSKPLTDIIQAVNEVRGSVPLWVKTTVDLSVQELDSVLAVALENEVTGVIDTNTTVDASVKEQLGWSGQGGISGDVPAYRQKATARMAHITRETRGTGLQRMGVGGN